MDVITTHINADFDCLGAMVAAQKLYPDAEMVFSGGQEPALRDFLQHHPNAAGRFKRLRDFDLAAVTRLILVDARQSARIGPFAEVARRDGVEIHIYDHHPEGRADLCGSVEHIEQVGSTVTVLARLFRERGIEPAAEEATMMMLGLHEDTGNLLFNSTTTEDYRAAAFLLEHGADLNTVADALVQELNAEQVALLHQLIDSRTVLHVNGIEVSIAHASIDHFVGDLAVLTHKLKDMENLDALFVVVRMGDRLFLVGRARIPQVHVGEILGEFGGGGHAFAGSATVRDLTLVQVLDRLPRVLQEQIRPYWEARHLMSFPVKKVARGETIETVRQILTRYNINAVPVVDKERVIGIITRQVAERAAHHGLAGSTVEEYMSPEFATVTPQTPVETLQELIVENNQRFVPVLEGRRLVGAITRTDLFRHLVADQRARRVPSISAGDGQGLRRKQVEKLIAEQLPTRIRDLLHQLGEVGDALQMDVFVVGGFVRDLLLRQENLDIDIVAEGDGIAFAAEFARRYGCRIRSHRKFGTAVIIFPDDFKIDVASARMEYYLEPGALPKVEHASIKLDLYRRDFTINTLAVTLNRGQFGELLDFFGGQRDLRDKVLRVLHNLSFVEDPTRMFRAIRFEQRLGFQMGVHTEHLLRNAVRLGFLEKVGGSRVFNELVIILKEADPLPAILRLAELDLLKYIHPALGQGESYRTLFEHAGRILHWYELLYTGRSCRRWLVYFLCLTASLDGDALEGVCRRLAIPPRYRQLLCEQRQEGQRVLDRLERRVGRRRQVRNSELYHWLKPFAPETLLFLMAAAGSDKVRRKISYFFTHLREVQTILTGKDLKAMGLPPGPRFKEIFHALLDARLDGEVASREQETALVRERFAGLFN